jgi:hypothetical protein
MDLDYKAVVRANKGKKVQMDKAETQGMTKAQRDLAKQEAAAGIFMDRAAELPSPSRPGHFLRTFGQSDREVIQNASSEFTVPQALALLNGPLVKALKSAHSDFQQALQRAATPAEKIEPTYLALLSRKPSPEETAILQEVIRERGDAAASDVLHSLLLAGQFLFVQ